MAHSPNDYDDEYDGDWSEDDPDAPRPGDLDDEDVYEETPTAQCPNCAAQVAEFAEQCPHCGDWITPITPPNPSRRLMTIVVVLLLIIALLWWVLY
ncbi:MAG: hypothetical protein ABIG44_08070 [Planctomycetota bacterium]